jgi:hypothetical protein
MIVGDIDWEAGERAIGNLPSGVRDERLADLRELRRLVTGSDYWRFATSQPVGAHRLFVTAPHGLAEDDVAVSIGRLGRDGILDAASVVCWRAPDPNFNGPVESFVRGYGPRRGGTSR